MKSRPIIFSGALAGEVNTGAKDVTRRPIKFRPAVVSRIEQCSLCKGGGFEWIECCNEHSGYDMRSPCQCRWPKCPHGEPGDELWVREAHYLYGKWVKSGLTPTGRQAWRFVPLRWGTANCVFYPDNPPDSICTKKTEVGWFKRLARFMPRWASRTTLTVKDVRAERLGDITEEDAKREGFDSSPSVQSCSIHTAASTLYPIPLETSSRSEFMEYWDAMYAKKPELLSGANPWVWRIEFERKGI